VITSQVTRWHCLQRCAKLCGFMQVSNLQGILAMLAAVAVFSIMDASMKQLALTYPPVQVSCLRGLASLPFMLLAVAWFGRWRDLIPRRWMQHALRGCLAIGMLTAFVYSVKILPLAEAYAIFLCAPLIVTALSVWLLHERVGWHRWLAIAVGLLGVITMLRPNTSQMATFGAIAAFGAALCYALGIVMIRNLARTETTLSIGFSFMVIVAIATGALALPTWVPLQATHWPWIVTLGLSGSLGQLLII
jgi:drug/metabolite transporter (DMT)-like permease